jgi:hypothetical protein
MILSNLIIIYLLRVSATGEATNWVFIDAEYVDSPNIKVFLGLLSESLRIDGLCSFSDIFDYFNLFTLLAANRLALNLTDSSSILF